MNLKSYLLEDDRGVSPVIGVILMVAITVILAAVIATFVMNMGPSEAQQPNVQWEWNNETDYFTLSHTGGDAADASNFVIAVDGTEFDFDGSEATGMPDEITASTTIAMNATTNGNPPEPFINIAANPDGVDELTLIWENPSNDQTQEVDTFDG